MKSFIFFLVFQTQKMQTLRCKNNVAKLFNFFDNFSLNWKLKTDNIQLFTRIIFLNAQSFMEKLINYITHWKYAQKCWQLKNIAVTSHLKFSSQNI